MIIFLSSLFAGIAVFSVIAAISAMELNYQKVVRAAYD